MKCIRPFEKAVISVTQTQEKEANTKNRLPVFSISSILIVHILIKVQLPMRPIPKPIKSVFFIWVLNMILAKIAVRIGFNVVTNIPPVDAYPIFVPEK